MKILLDTTCWYAAVFSEEGGSRKILKEAEEKGFTVILSETIFQETWKNIYEDNKKSVEILLDLLFSAPVDFLDGLTIEDIDQWRKLTVSKDIHVLAAAFVGKADVLITFDREHLLIPKVRKIFPIPIMDTKEFWQTWYPKRKKHK
jgi:putative PIN family toxin of toxin-antitoxin system